MSIAIAGATGAVGSALARRLSRAGGKPWLLGRRAAELEALAAECGGAPFTVVDFQQSESIAAQLQGHVPADCRGLAYCVGDIVLKPLRRAAPPDFRACFDLHVVGAAESVKALEPALKKNPGSAVVLFSSVAVQQGFQNHSVISSAKGAVEGLSRALAAELAPKVRVNAIAPSLSHSAMAAGMLSKMEEALAKQHPLQRVGQPEDLAALADFLLSPEDAGWITGQVIGVDGGRAAVA